MALRRNAELHSGESPFIAMKLDTWERDYWGIAVLLLEMQGKTLDSWLGADAAQAPSELVTQANQAKELEINDRIMRAGEEFHDRNKSSKQKQQAFEAAANVRWWELAPYKSVAYDADDSHQCPACNGPGILMGYEWSEEVVDQYPGDEEYLELVETAYLVEDFYCPACKLQLFGATEVDYAGLPETFEMQEERTREYMEEYNNE